MKPLRALFGAATYAAVLLLLGACAANVGEPDTAEAELPLDEAKADAITELRVRASETTVWIDKSFLRRGTGDAERIVLEGRASRGVTRGRAFVAAGDYGFFQRRSTRAFSVSWPAPAVVALLRGTSQLVEIEMTPSDGRPDVMTARAVAQVRFGAFAGTGAYVTAAVTPVVAGGRVVYRARGRATSAITDVEAFVGDEAIAAVRLVDDTRFEVDLDEALVARTIATGAELKLVLVSASGTVREKIARLDLVVERIGLTSADPFAQWPAEECDEVVRACLASLPAGATDTAECGDALEVLACSEG